MAGLSNPDATHELSDDAVGVLTRAERLALPTDTDDEILAGLRNAAIELAERYGLEVVLYDRSEETWMDHPHPSGPCHRDTIDGDKRPHLVEQIDEFAARGVPTSAWIATVPSLAEIVDVVSELGVDTILVPDQSGGTKLLDRLKPGGPAEIVDRVTALNLEHPVAVLVRHDDSSITVADSPER
jgi:hypothetical protein